MKIFGKNMNVRGLKKSMIIGFISSVIMSFRSVCYATTVTVDQSSDPSTMLGNLAGWVLNIVMIIGVFLVIWGVVQLALALQSQDASQRSHAMLFLASGALCIGAKFVLQAIGVTVA